MPKPKRRRREILAGALKRLLQAGSQARSAVRRLRQRLPQPVKRVMRRTTRWSLHAVHGVLISLVLIFVAAYLWLPTLADRKPEIETYLTSAIGNPVELDRLETFWDGLNPGVRVQGFRVLTSTARQPVIRLKEVHLSLAWWPLLTGRIEIGSLVLVEPSLVLERLADGRLRVTGLEAQAAPDPAQQDFNDWLLRQHEMQIVNGELEWVDRVPVSGSAEPERLAVRRVNITLHNEGDRHRLDLRADFPKSLCADCRLSMDFTGRPQRDARWQGEVALQARDLTLAALPRALRSRLPAGLDGHLDVQLASRWRDGRLLSVAGHGAVTDLSLPLPDEGPTLRVRRFEAKIDAEADGDSWQVELDGLRLGLTRAAWLAGRLHLDYGPERLRLAIDHLDVGDLATFAATLPREDAFTAWLRAARPAGNLDRLKLTLDGPPAQPRDWQFEAGVRGARFAAHGRLPGMSALTGELRATHDGGEFRLASGAGHLELPRVFREPLELLRLDSRVRWRKSEEDWLVQAADIEAVSRDGRVEGELELRLPHDPQLSPVLKLRAGLRNGNGAHAARYYPLILPEGLRTYLEHAVVSGRVTEATVELHGALRNFPFRDGKGRFEVRAHVEDGVFEYLPDWAPIEAIEADLQFTGTGMLITGREGRIRQLQAGRVTVAIDDFHAPGGPVVQVSGRTTGPLAAALAVLADSQSPRFKPYLLPGLKAEGDGILALELSIATRGLATRLGGHYRFSDISVELPFRDIRVEALRGAVEFSDAGPSGGKLNARLLGGDSVLEITPATVPARGAHLAARGLVTQAGFTQLFGAGLAAQVNGEMPWQAGLDLGAPVGSLRFESDLRALELRLPAPLAKAHGEPLMLVLAPLATDPGNAPVFDLQVGGRITGRLGLRRSADGWDFGRGHIGIGERVSALPDQDGLLLSVRLPSLDVDPWWQFLRGHLGDHDSRGWFDVLSRARAEVEALEVFGRPFGRLSLDLARRDGRWQGRLDGEAIAGEATVLESRCRPGQACAAGADRPMVNLTLTNLVLPPARSRDESPATVDPLALPTLQVRSQAFSMAGHAFGALDFLGEPAPDGWRITRLALNHPQAELKASGLWQADRQGGQATQIETTLTSNDFGQLLAEFGYPGEMSGGRLHLGARSVWPGAPGDFALARLDSDLDIVFSDGRLPKISPGAGRLLGVLDVASLTRYLSFDFSALFGKGLVFDSMKGKVAIAQGVARMQDFRIRTPGADIELTGRLGLVGRSVDLEMGVTPRLMEELAVTGGLIGGPVVGAAVAVLHNLVKKPFEKGTRIEYAVKGSWDNPAVTRLHGPVVAPPVIQEGP